MAEEVKQDGNEEPEKEKKKVSDITFPEIAYSYAGIIKKKYAQIVKKAMMDKEAIKQCGNPLAVTGSILCALITNILLDLRALFQRDEDFEAVRIWVTDCLKNIDNVPKEKLEKLIEPIKKRNERRHMMYG